MKTIYFYAVALTLAAGMTACGGGDNTNAQSTEKNDSVQEEVVEVEEEPVAEPVDETINGLVPGAEYFTEVNGWEYDITLYKDGSAKSSKSGEGSWRIESIHDEPFVKVILYEVSGDLYIDKNQKLHVNSAGNQGFELERINYVPDDAKGMQVGTKYSMPKFRWGETAYLTLNQDGTASFEFRETYKHNWKTIEIDGKEWIMEYGPGDLPDMVDGFLISPSLEYYRFSNSKDDRIIYEDGNLNRTDGWKYNRVGRMQK